jgi:hypothetical protein
MHCSIRFCLILSISAFVVPSFGHAAAKESLYDAKTAQKIDPSLQVIFGPQADKVRYDARMVRAAEMAANRIAARERKGAGN